ncbi:MULTISPECIES: IS200/IS605 family transposase [Aequorivita]|uniref:IS200/IS605 family transposase n=2 Tax=Aequorivita TaxID=153265 RepID=A0ABY8KTD8_9FLAO|nr:IS200/IS605 family transposase [Aequorivita sp. Ant34-E75]WGF92699.1 IS200/IS605 family transposase [Aequorivita sp. Ant34-E75]WGF92700.1 IS200/IS605 family transposase [Aequorivita sp. Ant34-E75]WGF92701.1 IS200/IS605 family transposase [Aequorivita sp. Ant34-E75]
MANTYTQIHIQVIFAVQNRQSLIKPQWKDELYKYITGIVQSYNHKVLQINGMPDHIHILFGMRPTQSISDLMKKLKQDSSKWINNKGFVNGKFSWQEGYGAFSYSRSHVPKVIKYIANQEEHHKSKTFGEEYLEILKESGIDYDERYILKSIT